MNYTHYDYLELAPGATSKRIEAAYAALLERFQYGMTDAGQDLSGLVISPDVTARRTSSSACKPPCAAPPHSKRVPAGVQ